MVCVLPNGNSPETLVPQPHPSKWILKCHLWVESGSKCPVWLPSKALQAFKESNKAL